MCSSDLTSGLPHTAFVTSQDSGPYAFVEGNTLVIVLDNNNTGETFIITMDYATQVTSGTSPSVFALSSLINIFPVTSSLNNFWVVFKSGLNTINGSIGSLANPSGSTFRYYFKNPAPNNFQNFSVGDQASWH